MAGISSGLAVLIVGVLGALLALVVMLVRTRGKLKDLELRSRTIIESEPECVKLQARDGTVIEMNSAGMELLEVQNPKDVVGHTVYEFIDPEDHAAYRVLTEQVFAGESHCIEFKILSRSGTVRWMESNAGPLRGKNNKIIALLAITRDITERKRLERKLQIRQMELDRICRVNTIGEVASGIAHELNQPLCAISSYAETSISLAQSRNYEQLEETLGLVFEQAQRASHIISSVRSLAEPRKQKFELFDVEAMIKDLKHMTNHYIDSNKINLQLEVDLESETAYGDRVQVEQVLINLIKNSAEAMTSRIADKRISIAAKSTSEGVTISVVDNGSGIEKDNLNKVLDSYFTTKENGLGMGLAICRSIIKSHGGRLWVDRSNGEGTSISFSLKTQAEDQRLWKHG